MGPGSTVGAELQENPDVDGIVFTDDLDMKAVEAVGLAEHPPVPTLFNQETRSPQLL